MVILLGGIVAESLLFGEEHISMGSSSDLKSATTWLYKAYRMSGFKGEFGWYGDTGINPMLLTHNQARFDKAVLATLEEGRQLALDTLQFEKPFLLALAHELANRKQLSRAQVEQIRKFHMRGEMKSPLLAYRNCLLAQTLPKGLE